MIRESSLGRFIYSWTFQNTTVPGHIEGECDLTWSSFGLQQCQPRQGKERVSRVWCVKKNEENDNTHFSSSLRMVNLWYHIHIDLFLFQRQATWISGTILKPWSLRVFLAHKGIPRNGPRQHMLATQINLRRFYLFGDVNIHSMYPAKDFVELDIKLSMFVWINDRTVGTS